MSATEEATGGVSPGGTSSFVRPVLALPAVRRMVRAVLDGERRVDLTGLRGSSAAFIVECLRAALGRPVVVCCADEETAHDTCSDLKTISAGAVRLFPEKDIFPQPFQLRENLSVRGQRNACLDLIGRGEVDIVVTSVAGFLEKTILPDVLARHAKEISEGGQIDLEALREHLVAVGYEAVHAVEELGQFAVRGAIVDIFDPSWTHPVRLELCDDRVESIRAFDIDSQRSLHRQESVRLLPAATVLPDATDVERLEAALRRRGLSPEAVRHIRDEIEQQRVSYLIRRYAPVMGTAGSMLEFFTEPPVVFFREEDRLGKALDELQAEFDKINNLSEPEYPLLELGEYIHPPEYYTAFDVSHVHQWSVGADRGGGRALVFHTSEHPSVPGKLDALVETLRSLHRRRINIHIFSESDAQRERLADLLEEDEALVHLPVGWMTSGFVWEEAGIAMLTDHQIFRRVVPRPVDRRKTKRLQGYRHEHLQTGDFVVHVDYGIGRYVGLEKVAVEAGETECLTLRYDDGDRIFVPVDQMPLVQKYIGKEGAVPRLDRLGGGKWRRTKEKTKKAIENAAEDMLRAFAEREVVTGNAFGPDTPWQRELEASFPFEETPDQLRATAELKVDMEKPRPMDRLICGDVGFGKTEVAIRAAFKAVAGGKQVAVLVPTTILALQHYKTFRQRMAAFPVRIEMLSRFKSTAEQKAIVKETAKGGVDIVIGTHRLFSSDVAFHDLGLLVVDEEHRFGVRHKEKLKRLKANVDVLSLTATPIPRTLHMALSGLRPISVIDTAPRNRHPVRTAVRPFDEDLIVQAIRAEVARGGQVFFVHNRVASIHSIQAFLERLMPEVRFGVGHGQMGEKQLENVILSFLEHEFDVLVSTTIIESGLDFPNVNTIIINRADRFGLAELYQLRGRVGRRERQAFAYLLVPRNFSITPTASRRLQAMEEFEELGSGYRLAMRDLEIRGAGNILGIEQHGQMAAVGFELYCRMLRAAVEKLQGRQEAEAVPCKVETKLDCLLPASYVDDADERMALYRRLARMGAPEEVEDLRAEITDRFGPPPKEAINLLEVTEIKVRAQALGIHRIRLGDGRIDVGFLPGRALEPKLCARIVETFEGRVLFKSAGDFGLTLTPPDRRLLDAVRTLLRTAGAGRGNGGPAVAGHPAKIS